VNVWYDVDKNGLIWSRLECALRADDDLYLIFQFGTGRFDGNQIILPFKGKLILRAFFAHLLDGSTVLVLYYLLGATLRRRVGYTLVFAMHF